VDSSIAWTVEATDTAGRPRSDLPAHQRWRGVVLDSYEGGIWSAEFARSTPLDRTQTELPDFGPRQFVLTFTVKPRQAGGVFLADPIHLGPPTRRWPVVRLVYPEYPLFVERVGTLLPVGRLQRAEFQRLEYRYVQVMPEGAFERIPALPMSPTYLEHLVRQAPLFLEDWTVRLLRRLVEAPGSGLRAVLPPPPPDGSTRGFLLDPQAWEPVARALTGHLAGSGEYTYTLEQIRQDEGQDPVVDFLVNVKQGHCERYASALALMLRSVGIPARIVKGFRGAEYQGDGVYAVRHSQAHSWVEVLVPGRSPREGFEWLTLDPTPEADAPRDAFSLARWWDESRRSSQEFWRNLIVEYNAEERAELMDQIVKMTAPPWVALGIVVVAVMLALGTYQWWRRRHRRPAPPRPALQAKFYGRLVALLARHARLAPRPDQTPHEFGAAAAVVLQGHAATAALADLPNLLAKAFYRVRFGGEQLDEAEQQALDARLDELAAALRQAGTLAGPAPA
jgi:transglutaminase-like putative cysteine protease